MEFIKFIISQYNVIYNYTNILQECSDLAFEPIYLEKKISTYSKGMIQKISLIALFSIKREIYILDEPMSGLDIHTQLLVQDKINIYTHQEKLYL